MKNIRIGSAAAVAALALVMTGCATNEPGATNTTATGSGATALSGNIAGTGSSAMSAAQEAWIAAYQTKNSGVKVSYSPEGSGAGRTGFIGGGVDFAGSDRAFKDDEMGKGKFGKCTAESNAVNLPVYISPIAIMFNVAGVNSLNMDADTVAKVFSNKITRWNDPAIVALNPGVALPDATITTVHRSDNSGTTENFTDTLNKAAASVWTEKASGDWPATLMGEAAKGTAGVVQAVKSGQNTIGYADESQTKGMTTVKFGKAGAFVGPTAEAAAAIVENSKKVAGRADNDWALNLDRTAAGYPFVLVAYAMACEDYKDDKQAALVKSYLTYIASEEGQKYAQDKTGSAPLSATMRGNVQKTVTAIK